VRGSKAGKPWTLKSGGSSRFDYRTVVMWIGLDWVGLSKV